MTRSAAEVKQWYADTHGISLEQATAAIAYRSAFRQIFNDPTGSSQFRRTLDVQTGSSAKAFAFLTQILSGATSFLGGIIGATGTAAVEFDKKKGAQKLAGLSELKPAIESCGSRLQNFTEDMAEDFTVMSLHKISELKKDQAAELARQDAEFLIGQIIDGKFNDQINDSEVIGVGNIEAEEKQALDSLRKSMVDSVAQQKGLNPQQEENLMKARVAASAAREGRGGESAESVNKGAAVINHNHEREHEHKDLGRFTHSVMSHEQHHQRPHQNSTH